MAEEKNCLNCKYIEVDCDQEPCKSCTFGYGDRDVWTPEGKSMDTTEPAEPDPVNHPAHYADSCSLECIQVMELTFGKNAVINFCMCNAFKYLWRYKNKNGEEDLKKAEWYLKKAYDLGDDTERLNCMLRMKDELSENK